MEDVTLFQGVFDVVYSHDEQTHIACAELLNGSIVTGKGASVETAMLELGISLVMLRHMQKEPAPRTMPGAAP